MHPHLRLPYSVALGKALELLPVYHKLAPPLSMLNKTCTYVLYGTSTTPRMCNPQEFFIVLYMTGDCAIGDGVKKYLF